MADEPPSSPSATPHRYNLRRRESLATPSNSQSTRTTRRPRTSTANAEGDTQVVHPSHISQLLKKDLVQECVDKGLDVTGTKDVLIARIREHAALHDRAAPSRKDNGVSIETPLRRSRRLTSAQTPADAINIEPSTPVTKGTRSRRPSQRPATARRKGLPPARTPAVRTLPRRAAASKAAAALSGENSDSARDRETSPPPTARVLVMDVAATGETPSLNTRNRSRTTSSQSGSNHRADEELSDTASVTRSMSRSRTSRLDETASSDVSQLRPFSATAKNDDSAIVQGGKPGTGRSENAEARNVQLGANIVSLEKSSPSRPTAKSLLAQHNDAEDLVEGDKEEKENTEDKESTEDRLRSGTDGLNETAVNASKLPSSSILPKENMNVKDLGAQALKAEQGPESIGEQTLGSETAPEPNSRDGLSSSALIVSALDQAIAKDGDETAKNEDDIKANVKPAMETPIILDSKKTSTIAKALLDMEGLVSKTPSKYFNFPVTYETPNPKTVGGSSRVQSVLGTASKLNTSSDDRTRKLLSYTTPLRKAPKAIVPDAETRKTDSSEANVSDSKTLNASAPAADNYEEKAPNTEMADAEKPDAHMLDPDELEAPEAEAPEAETPEAEAPEAEAPEDEVPEAEAPEDEVPEAPEDEAPEAEPLEAEPLEAEAPETEPLEAEPLETEAPEAKLLEVEVLEPDDMLKVDASEVDGPESNAPDVDLPDVDATIAVEVDVAKFDAHEIDALGKVPPGVSNVNSRETIAPYVDSLETNILESDSVNDADVTHNVESKPDDPAPEMVLSVERESESPKPDAAEHDALLGPEISELNEHQMPDLNTSAEDALRSDMLLAHQLKSNSQEPYENDSNVLGSELDLEARFSPPSRSVDAMDISNENSEDAEERGDGQQIETTQPKDLSYVPRDTKLENDYTDQGSELDAEARFSPSAASIDAMDISSENPVDAEERKSVQIEPEQVDDVDDTAHRPSLEKIFAVTEETQAAQSVSDEGEKSDDGDVVKDDNEVNADNMLESAPEILDGTADATHVEGNASVEKHDIGKFAGKGLAQKEILSVEEDELSNEPDQEEELENREQETKLSYPDLDSADTEKRLAGDAQADEPSSDEPQSDDERNSDVPESDAAESDDPHQSNTPQSDAVQTGSSRSVSPISEELQFIEHENDVSQSDEAEADANESAVPVSDDQAAGSEVEASNSPRPSTSVEELDGNETASNHLDEELSIEVDADSSYGNENDRLEPADNDRIEFDHRDPHENDAGVLSSGANGVDEVTAVESGEDKRFSDKLSGEIEFNGAAGTANVVENGVDQPRESDSSDDDGILYGSVASGGVDNVLSAIDHIGSDNAEKQSTATEADDITEVRNITGVKRPRESAVDGHDGVTTQQSGGFQKVYADNSMRSKRRRMADIVTQLQYRMPTPDDTIEGTVLDGSFGLRRTAENALDSSGSFDEQRKSKFLERLSKMEGAATQSGLFAIDGIENRRNSTSSTEADEPFFIMGSRLEKKRPYSAPIRSGKFGFPRASIRPRRVLARNAWDSSKLAKLSSRRATQFSEELIAWKQKKNEPGVGVWDPSYMRQEESPRKRNRFAY